MKILLVTPVRNAENLLVDTFDSILTQKNFLFSNLTYVVVDGSSTDQTLRVIKEYSEKFLRLGIGFSHISEPDSGMYDALSKGFKRSDHADIYAYINAGDIFSNTAFSIMQKFCNQDNPWLKGMDVQYNLDGEVTSVTLPFSYPSSFILNGYFGLTLRHIQQESTCWHNSLHQLIDFEKLSKFKLAGDYYLWHTFAKVTSPSVINRYIGGFRSHNNQLSASQKKYKDEFNKIRDKNFFMDIFRKPFSVIWKFLIILPPSLKEKFNKKLIN